MKRQALRRGPGQRQRGQVLVIFTIAAVAIIAMVGLVIDGGWTFVQRRDQQNVADSAAMAAGYAYVNSNYSAATAVAAAKNNAAANGYQDGVNNVAVDVSISSSTINVTVSKPHQNYFAGIVGFSSWNVSATAQTKAGVPNQAIGAMPLIFNQKVLQSPYGYGSSYERSYDEPGSGTEDVPQTATAFNWSVFCTSNGSDCNASSDQVDSLIDGHNSNPQTVTTAMVIGPLNAGAHTTLFSDMAAYVGQDCFPVAIVDDSGTFQYLASFCLTGSLGGDTKEVRGYFEGPIEGDSFDIVPGVPGGTTVYGGVYVVRLTN
ncbi:MAG TPA: Tad domain-containing protein [Candidatus Limnocylindrales bacterium]